MTNRENVLAIIILVILCFTTNHANAQLEKKYANYEELEYKGLKYGFYKPHKYDKNKSYPLVCIYQLKSIHNNSRKVST